MLLVSVYEEEIVMGIERLPDCLCVWRNVGEESFGGMLWVNAPGENMGYESGDDESRP